MNNVAPNNLAGRMEKEIRAKPEKEKKSRKRASAVYVLNNDLKAILNLNRITRAFEHGANRRLSRLQAA